MGKTRIFNLWLGIQGSLWFVPSLMIFSAFCMAFLTISFDREVAYSLLREAMNVQEDSLVSYLIVVGPEGARSVLSTIAGSMITVAGVTFSITIVALTLASSQFGPRLLSNFMQDRSTQLVLGVFVATFIYCLLVLRSVKSANGDLFVPTVSVNISVLLAVVNSGILIYFIHNIAISIRAEHVISVVYTNLIGNIDRIFGDLQGDEDDDDPIEDEASLQGSYTATVEAGSDGYLQAIDHKRLIEIARQHDVVVTLELRAGNYATRTTPAARVRYSDDPDEQLAAQIRAAFIFGNQRTPEQDIEFAIHQLVEIAVRSLSPGINDPFTAASCVDYLSSALCYLARKSFPESRCCDQNGVLRVVIKPVRFGDLLDTAFNQLRQHSDASVAVTIRLMEAYGRIAGVVRRDGHKRDLLRHADMLQQSALRWLHETRDKEDLQLRYDDLVAALDAPGR